MLSDNVGSWHPYFFISNLEELALIHYLHYNTLITFNILFQDLLSHSIFRSLSCSSTLRWRNWELILVLLLFVFHVNIKHSGKYTSFNDTQVEKNKPHLKSDMSTKINLLKLVLFKLTFRHLVSIHGWSKTDKDEVQIWEFKRKLNWPKWNYLPSQKVSDTRIFVLFWGLIHWKYHPSMTLCGRVSQCPAFILKIIPEQLSSIYYHNLFFCLVATSEYLTWPLGFFLG